MEKEMKTLSVTEVARHFADYVNRVAYRGERFTLVRGNKRVAELKPVQHGLRLGDLPEVLKSIPNLSPDDVDEFAKDLAGVSSITAAPRDPWES
jgi:antitoxin (DNA-binding transcriptional repressor) of toxin-antitoxin stability system